MIGGISSTITLEDIKGIEEVDLLAHYIGVKDLPCIINSPFRKDRKPSFGITCRDNKVFFKDFSTGESGDIWKLLMLYTNCSFQEVLNKVYQDRQKLGLLFTIRSITYAKKSSIDSDIQVVVRDWKKDDEEYWSSYGVSLKALKYANVHPIERFYYCKEGNKTLLTADKLAYVYVEFEDNKPLLKIYQPYGNIKWLSKQHGQIISLWDKIPSTGETLIITASLKDSLCVWCNTGIPCINLQGEGYKIQDSIVSELKRRFSKIYILFDNDEAGVRLGKQLAEETGFNYIELPKINGTKDASDLYKSLENKKLFKCLILGLL